MAAAPPYIPNKNADLYTWTQNYRDTVTATPAAFGLVSADVTAITNSANAFLASYDLANDPATRTPVSINAMNADKFSWKQLARTYSAQIRLNPGVTDANKLALGLNLPNFTPSPIPAPISWPILSFVSASALTHVLTSKDSSMPAGKFKPFGAQQLQLVGKPATTPTGLADDLPTVSFETKTPMQIVWDPGDLGKQVRYYGRWVTRKGLVGPWGPALDCVIA